MRLSFVSVEDSITAIGFRKVAAVARAMRPDTEVCYVVPMGMRSFLRLLLKRDEIRAGLSDEDLQNICSHLAKADMVCFSSMTPFAQVTKKIIKAIRVANPKTYIVWGGIHPILDPEDAIQCADAICIGEGETAFRTFLSDYESGKNYTSTRNFWFHVNGKVIRNGFLPLHKPKDMEAFPLPLYADGELLYKKDEGFVPLGLNEYLSFNDLVYNTVWSIGCPYKCTYCSNSRFIENDKDYRKLRYPSVDYIIAEIKSVITKHPHISTIRFHDDSFMAIPSKILQEFAEEWRKEINIPFWVYGLIPIFVKRDKLQILVRAGMNRVRMGIQSGSDRILAFYKRPNRPDLIAKGMSSIGEFSKNMIAPFYDIIVDNPIETREDVLDTLNLLYNAPRPYCAFVYALRIIPNTEMANDFAKLNVCAKDIGEGYKTARPTLANAMVYMMSVFRPPKWIYNQMLKHVKPYEEDPERSLLFPICHILYKFRVAYDMIQSLDFSVIPGKTGWVLWKLGIIGFFQRKRMKKAWKDLRID
jgi:anaerobic magnesium-protoporphyrin IX monomethyl ester cyclase